MITCKVSVGQYFLNGSFENNIATTNQSNITNYIFDSLMSNSVSFGSTRGGGPNGGTITIGKFPDTNHTCGSGAQNGNWYVALAKNPYASLSADSISLKLSSHLIAGYSYSISFYTQSCSFPGFLQIGISNNNNTFGRTIYTTPFLDTIGGVYTTIWIKRSFTFIAPISALYITITSVGSNSSWLKVDNFTFDSCIMKLNIGNDTTLCQGASLQLNATTPYSTYLWQNNSTDSVFTITQPSTYWVKVTNACGSIIDTIHVAFVAPVSLHINDTSFCDGNTCIINATNGSYSKYLWNTGDTNSYITVHDTGNYIVTASNAVCKITDTVHVSTFLPPPLNLVHDTIICDGNILTINAKNNTYKSYLWNNGAITPQINITQPGKYSVTASNANCKIKDSTTLNLFTLPHLFLPKDTIVCFSQYGAVILDAGKFKSYYWHQNGEQKQSITAATSGIYKVTVTDSNNCFNSDSTIIEDNCTYQLYMPNAFTPNNDSLNDIFKGYGMGIAEFEMHIYNRLAVEVFTSNDMSIGWDGTFKNQPCMGGTYVWMVTYRLKNETNLRTDRGTVTLLK